MGSTAKKPAVDYMADLYDRDFVLWTREMARRLREHRFSELDIENLAEEVESMGKRDQREVGSRLQVLLMRLIKWQIQPERRTPSWRSTIDTQRDHLDRVLGQSPSLRSYLSEHTQLEYERAARHAIKETKLATQLPDQCPFTEGQILSEDFLPE